MATVQTVKRQRGVIGWVFLIIFLGFNLLMLIGLVAGLGGAGDAMQTGTEAEKAGAAIGATLGAGVILVVWCAGAVILGLFVWLTSGRQVIITKEVK